MNKQTKEFIDKCLEKAAEDIKNQTPEEIVAKEKELALIRIRSSVALEKLETQQRNTYNSHIRTLGYEPRYKSQYPSQLII